MKLSDYEGKFFRVIKDGRFNVLGYPHDEPGIPYICFVESKRYLKYCCRNKDISCIICKEELSDDEMLQESKKGIAICKYPRIAFYHMHNYLADHCDDYRGKFEDNVVGRDCSIHPTAIVADKGVRIGNNVTIEEYVVIRQGVTIGNNSVIRTGAIIGGENQLVSYDEDCKAFHVHQVGRTYIGNSVEISYYTMVARGVFLHETTWIDDNVCIEMGSMVGHNVKIGCNSWIGPNCQICGNTNLGENVRMAPGAIVSNRLNIGNNSNIIIGSVVVDNVTEGKKMTGNFAIEHSQYLKWHMKKLRN